MNDKMFECSLCDFTSAWKQNVTRHIKTHSEQKPHDMDNKIITRKY